VNGAFYIGAIGLQSQQRALDILAGNIANINTPAFKRSEVQFSEVLASHSDPDVPRADLADAPVASAGVMVDATPMIDEMGQLQPTGHPMDVAIEGSGFIELMGPEGQTLLWRGGTLKVGDDGMLATSTGIPLKASISVPSDATAITIGDDGVVSAQTSSSTTATQIGQISLVKASDMTALKQLDGGLYRVDDGAKLTDVKPGEDGTGMLVQGSIEGSNADMTSEMVQMMLVQRAYSANAQMVQAADQLMGIANGLKR
jgi:flagellar basal-body rod protein FlgG